MFSIASPIYWIYLFNAFTGTLAKQFPAKNEDKHSVEWSATLSESWQVLGPFSQHAREQHFISPSYPIDLMKSWPIDFGKSHYSSISEGAAVKWSNVSSYDGHIAVEFPEIRWKELRSSEGWAALQHHALLHSELVINPPKQVGRAASVLLMNLLAIVQQVSFFTIIPDNPPANYTPVWHNGNIYSLAQAPSHLVELPSPPSLDYPTKYHVVASGDYEIRLFGDPLVMEGQESPVQRLVFKFYPFDQTSVPAAQLEPQLDVVPDFVDGWAFAQNGSIGIGVKSANEEWWEVTAVPHSPSDGAIEWLAPKLKLGPHQSRILPLQLIQHDPYYGCSFTIQLKFSPYNCGSRPPSSRQTFTLSATIPISHKKQWQNGLQEVVYKATYLIGRTPFYFMAKPPQTISPSSPSILALHGAGIESSSAFWTASIRRQAKSWVIFPTGRTEWGFDWHGPSTLDVWGSFEALGSILQTHESWSIWSTRSPRVVLMGHSNGGQGVWYQASRFPDKVIAAIPVAAYIKSQSYVPLTQSRGGHFMDAALRGILEGGLQPDDNDLFLSNLVSTRLMVVHGGDDRNVPTWHSRQLVDGLKMQYSQHNVTYREVAGTPHWWDTVFTNDFVQTFLEDAVEDSVNIASVLTSFTLTVAIPEGSGSLHGFLVRILEIPGRLGRLRVHVDPTFIAITSTNVWEYSFDINPEWGNRYVVADGTTLVLPEGKATILLSKRGGTWQMSLASSPRRPSGPLHRILAGNKSLVFVVPEGHSRYLSAAIHIAHNLLSYLRIDSDIVYDLEASGRLASGTLECSNLVIMGGHQNTFGQALIDRSPVPITFLESGWIMRGQIFESDGLGLAFLHPHPTCEMGLSLFLAATDDSGIERIVRLFPLRTGGMSPEWIITSTGADKMGAGGLLGAGYWSREWGWSDAQSWMGFNSS